MRRHPIRFVFAVLATSSLVACADLATAPQAPQGPRFDGAVADTTVTDTTKSDTTKNSRMTSTQGSHI